MAITVGIFQMSGGGKTTSLVINPDGTYNPSDYQGMNPETTVVFNSDRKRLPFKLNEWIEGTNVFTTSNTEKIKEILQKINVGTKIKSVFIDTINGVTVDKEMLESKKLTFDKWADFAKEIYELISICNGMREDLIIYFTGHVTLFTDVDGNESKCLITNGRKLEKIKLESKLPIVLFGAVDRGSNGNNKYYFETQANRSTAKTPLGMFSEFKIPNSLSLVDKTIREYYEIK